MKKKMLLVLGVLLVVSVGGSVFADSYKTPAEIYSELTGVTIEEAHELRRDGKTYGELADEKGFLEAFEEESLASKLAVLELRVKEGTITRERADEIIAIWQSDQCDEPGLNQLGKNAGLRFGNGSGSGLRDGSGNGSGYKNGMGNGTGFGNRNDGEHVEEGYGFKGLGNRSWHQE